MRLRTYRTRLFEAFSPRHQTVHALEVLAGTGAVELDANPKVNASLEVKAIVDAIQEFDRLAAPYRQYLPAHERRPQALEEKLDQVSQRAIDTLRRWIAEIESSLERLRELETECDSLRLLQEYLGSLGEAHEDLSLLTHEQGMLYKGLYACPHEQPLEGELKHVFKEVKTGLRHRFLILVGLPESAPEIESAVRDGTCYRIDLPEWLAPKIEDWPSQIDSRVEVVQHDIVLLRETVESMKHDQPLRESLGDVDLLRWYTQQAAALTMDEKYCYITGWTSYSEPTQLEAELRQAGIDGFVRFLNVPSARSAPTRTLDTWWARPFQSLISLYGTPEEDEVDPSAVLVFVVPLLFGYMFPDVGHGLLLVVLSAALYRRWPEGRFLIPCGVSAMLFGLVFGDVFGFDNLIRPLWLKPLEHPMAVLIAPMVLGVGLIFLGLVFSGIESHWRGMRWHWVLVDAALIVLYLGGLAALFHPYGRYAAGAALAWYVAGSLIIDRRQPLRALGRSIGRLLESVFQLTINTISFLRVGAFALAHAALSSAALLIAGATSSRVSYWIVLILVQALVVTLETLVVFVQTTRLVFFEFFIRFLRAEGRVFKPLLPPHKHDQTPSP